MEKKIETKNKIVKIVVWVIVVAGLLLTAHILVNYFNIVEVLKAIHGG